MRFIESIYEYDGADRLTRLLNRTLRPDPEEDQPEPSWGMRGLWRRLKNWVNRPAWAGSGITISDYAYTYDNVGNRLTMSVDGSTHTYTYDDIYQLIGVAGGQTHSYDYDDVGNRETADGIGYASNILNQYTEVNNVEFDYDPSGNLIDDGVHTYTYDNENRLKRVIAGSTTVDYAYDPFGRRQMMSINETAETYFIYDGDHLLAEYDGTGNMIREYVYGPWLDEVVSMKRVSPSSRYFYYQDGLGSVSEILDDRGVLFEQYEYEPYGKTTIKSKNGTTLPNGSAIGNRFAFTGRRLDYETKTYDYRERAYSTEIGRFLQRDPTGYSDGINLYTYAHNNPATYTDPFGEQALDILITSYRIYRHIAEYRRIERAVNAIPLPEDLAKNPEIDRMRHAEASYRICSQYGPTEAAAAGIAQEIRGYRNAKRNDTDWSLYDTVNDLYYDYLGIRAASGGGTVIIRY